MNYANLCGQIVEATREDDIFRPVSKEEIPQREAERLRIASEYEKKLYANQQRFVREFTYDNIKKNYTYAYTSILDIGPGLVDVTQTGQIFALQHPNVDAMWFLNEGFALDSRLGQDYGFYNIRSKKFGKDSWMRCIVHFDIDDPILDVLDYLRALISDDVKRMSEIERIQTLPFTYEDITNTPEYREFIRRGFEDTTSDIQKPRRVLRFENSAKTKTTIHPNGYFRRQYRDSTPGFVKYEPTNTLEEFRNLMRIILAKRSYQEGGIRGGRRVAEASKKIGLTYDQLSEDAKEHVLMELADVNVDYDWWTEEVAYLSEKILKKYGITFNFKDITFDMYHRDLGLGIHVVAEDKFYKKVLAPMVKPYFEEWKVEQENIKPEVEKEVSYAYKQGDEDLFKPTSPEDVEIRKKLSKPSEPDLGEVYYSLTHDRLDNEYELYVTFSSTGGSQNDTTTVELVAPDCVPDNVQLELDDWFKKEVIDYLFNQLNKQYEYLTSEEAIVDTIEANEWTYDENGYRV